jgi:hypothetical protein
LLDLDVFPGTGLATVNFNHARNPQRTAFLNAKMVNGNTSPGIGSDLVYRDPWGNPYIISVDLNGDSKTRDGFYSQGVVSKTPASATAGYNGLVLGDNANPNSFEANAPVMVWSFGPDGHPSTDLSGAAIPGINANQAPNKDNVTSW